MRSVVKFLCGALFILALPASAGAQTFWVSPFVGTTSGNDLTHANAGIGIAAGAMVYKNWIGVEGEYSDALVFFKDDGYLTHRRLLTAMGNVVVNVPYVGNDKFHLFATGGLGVIRPHIEEAGGFSKVEVKKLGFNVGGGIVGYLNKNVGVRGDVRYLHALKDDVARNAFAIDFGALGFWRTSAGVVIRF